ncbi:MAG: 3',5'-cyclic-AMP phosphodiesterase [Thermostichales cyanobacterium BF4_bins_65]
MNPVYLVQFSDFHLFSRPESKLLGVVTEETFQAVFKQIQSLQPTPEVLLMTGDLSQDGSESAYRRIHRYLEPLEIPTYWLAGNHDRLPNMVAHLNSYPISAEKTFQRGNWSFTLLNSLLPGKDSGYLSRKNLDILQANLEISAQLGQHAVVALHHPPMLVGSTWLDTTTLQYADRFFEVLDRFSHVRLVLFGHIHQEFSQQRQGVDYWGCPSTCIQFLPKSHEFGLEIIPPGFRHIWLYPDGSYRTEVQRVPEALRYPDMRLRGY